ncbi:MAG: CpaF family protein [Clostridia bacterium]|nr:CpaF family protein [Clostridia bacterium]
MVINAYKTVLAEKNRDNKEQKRDIIKHITKRLLEEELETIERRNIEKLTKKIEWILVNKYEIVEEKNVNDYIKEVLDKIYGYGILEKYLNDGITSDIRAVAFNNIYVKQKGNWIKTEETFANEEEFNEYIRFCALKNNYNINNENPIGVFSDRKNGLRIEAGIEPVNVNNANLVIRIHKNETPKSLEQLFEAYHMLDKYSYEVIKDGTKRMANILICGKGGSGKTTLLRAIINTLPENIAINTNEETAELYIENRNIIQRECLLTRVEDKNVDLEKLSRNSLVMSNDVIVIGELKGKEANSFFDAISTGHMGIATVHSDSTKNAIDRIITLIRKDVKASQYTDRFLRRFLAGTIDYIILVKDFQVKEVAAVKYDEEKDVLNVINVYRKARK